MIGILKSRTAPLLAIGASVLATIAAYQYASRPSGSFVTDSSQDRLGIPPGQPDNTSSNCRSAVLQDATSIGQSDERASLPFADQLSLFKKLNADRCPQVTAKEAFEAYKTARTREHRDTFLSGKTGYGPWPAIVGLVLGAILAQQLTRLGKWAARRIEAMAFRLRLFRTTALRRYRTELVRRLERTKIPFGRDQWLDLRTVYVPVLIRGRGEQETSIIDEVLSNIGRLVVLGAPGAGKSTLLRHLAIRCAESFVGPGWERCTPVLLELNRLTDRELNLEREIMQVFERARIAKAPAFVRTALDDGEILLLFDGLDELEPQQRAIVARSIGDLLSRFPRCPSVVTCRAAAYQNELIDVVEIVADIVEFSDYQIWRFLQAWKSRLPAERSPHELVEALRANPQILSLARNPLMLTIIAFLYCDPHERLPDSRVELYERATALFLDQWHHEQNRFGRRPKERILQTVAVRMFDRAEAESASLRSIPYDAYIEIVREVLADMSLERSRAEEIAEEIKLRSGLLVETDGGRNVQFVNLSFQEYFVAAAFGGKTSEILAKYVAAPTRWREPMLLWCGHNIVGDDVLRNIRERSLSSAVACIAEAQQIDAEVVEDILRDAQAEFCRPQSDAAALTAALAAAAARRNERGKRLIQWFADLASDSSSKELANRAAAAIAKTSLPEGAQLLAARWDKGPHIREALSRMGDLAVEPIAIRAIAGEREAAWMLAGIGTIASAQALAACLRTGVGEIQNTAAWALCQALPRWEVIESFRFGGNSEAMPAGRGWEWVWSPFVEPEGSQLPKLAPAIASGIANGDIQAANGITTCGDPRILLPVALKLAPTRRDMLEGDLQQVDSHQNLSRQSWTRSSTSQAPCPACTSALARLEGSDLWKAIVNNLPATARCLFLKTIRRFPMVSASHWARLGVGRREGPGDFLYDSSPKRVAAQIATAACIAALVAMTALVAGRLPSSRMPIVAWSIAAWCVSFLCLVQSTKWYGGAIKRSGVLRRWLSAPWDTIRWMLRGHAGVGVTPELANRSFEWLFPAVVFALNPTVLLDAHLGTSPLERVGLVALAAALLAIGAFCVVNGKSRERNSRNPLAVLALFLETTYKDTELSVRN